MPNKVTLQEVEGRARVGGDMIRIGTMRDILVPEVVIWRPVKLYSSMGGSLADNCGLSPSEKGGMIGRVHAAEFMWEPGIIGIGHRHGGPVVVVKEPLPDDWTYLVVRKNRLNNIHGGVLFAELGEIEFPVDDFLRFRTSCYRQTRGHLNDSFADRAALAESVRSPVDGRYLRVAYDYCWKEKSLTARRTSGEYSYCHFGGLAGRETGGEE